MNPREKFAKELLEDMYEALKEMDYFTSDPSVGIYGDEELLGRYRKYKISYQRVINPMFICDDCYTYHPTTPCKLQPPED